MRTFYEFIDRKTRQDRKHLRIIKKMLESHGIEVKSFLDEQDDPYIFAVAPNRSLSFDGIRIYKIGGNVAYRIQREDRTPPDGKSYPLNIEDMFEDFMADDIKQDEAGKRVINTVVYEVKTFFDKSLEAEKEVERGDFDTMGDPLDRTMIPTTGTDYSSKLHGSGWGSSGGR
jgi:hypothetical protein